MTEHLEWHQHAFLDENDNVITIAVFEEWAHNHQLLEDIRIANGASKIVCCCQYGMGAKEWKWDDVNKVWIKPEIVIPLDAVSEEFQV